MSIVLIIARILFAPVFIVSGYKAAKNPAGRVAKTAALGIPFPEAATRLNGAIMVAAGLLLAAGVFAREAAAVLTVIMVPTTLAGHPFWQEETLEGRSAQETQVMKNLAIMGGLLAVIAGPV